MSPFWIVLELRMMEVVVTTGAVNVQNSKLKGSVKELNILTYFFFRPSFNRVLFPMFYLLVEGECQILVFQNIIS